MALLVAAVLGGSLFVFAEARVASPLIRLAAFRNRVLSASLAMKHRLGSDDGDAGGRPSISPGRSGSTRLSSGS